MDCAKLPLEPLVSGQLPFPKRLSLHWHIIRCSKCRARYLHARSILSGLRSLAEEPTTASMRRKALDAFPESLSLPGSSGAGEKVRPKMKRITYVALCATLILAVTGSLAAKYLLRPSFGCSDSQGRTWHVTGDFHGRIDILDSKAGLAATFTNDFGEMKEPAEITVSGQTVTVQGVGRHEIRGKDGALLGYAVFRPLTEKEYLATRGLSHLPTPTEELDLRAKDWLNSNWSTHGGVSGTESAPWGVRGFDSAMELRWRVFGTVAVQIVDGDGKKVLASARTQGHEIAPPDALRPYVNGKEPDLFVTIGERSWNESGYGIHKLKDGSGRVLLIVEAFPATR